MSPDTDLEKKDNSSLFCPHLGLRDDPGSLAAYPSAHNLCHRCAPPSIPALHHQGSTCLTLNHSTCPAQTSASLPPELVMPASRKQRTKWDFSFVWVGILLLGTALIAIGFISGKNKPAAALETVTLPAAQVHITQIPTATPEPTSTNTVIPSPTSTITTTREPQAQPGIHQLESALGVDIKLIMYRLLEGDQLPILVRRYKTSEQAVADINAKPIYPLWANRVIVIPLNTEDVSSLPVFEAYEIVDEQIDLQSLAEILSVDVIKIKYFNLCPQNCLLKKGDWVLLPREP